MAGTAASVLIDRARRYVRDIPLSQDPIAGSLTSAATTITTTTSSFCQVGDPVEVDTETMLVRAVSGTTVTVLRGMFGSTAATHATGTALVRQPAFFAADYLDAVNQGLQACFPKIYQPVLDTSLTGLADTYEYTVPNMVSPSIPIPFVSEVEFLASGTSVPYRKTRRFEVKRGSTPKIKFRSATVAGDTLRVTGFGPFPALTSTADTLASTFPVRAEYLLSLYAAGSLLMSGEAGRVRSSAGMTDDREQANRTGASGAIGQALLQRFQAELSMLAMAPMPRHVKSVM